MSDFYIPTLEQLGKAIKHTANVLDDSLPGWAPKIDLHKLDMASHNYCVGGQLGVIGFSDKHYRVFPDANISVWNAARSLGNPSRLEDVKKLMENPDYLPFMAFLSPVYWYNNPDMVEYANDKWVDEITARLR